MVGNPTRGCGTKKPGGSYLEADTSEFGDLRAASYLLGTHFQGGSFGDTAENNIFTNAPPRAMQEIDPSASLALSRIVFYGESIDWNNEKESSWYAYRRFMSDLGTYGLLDFVGAQYYSPNSFIKELEQHGPSRRVPSEFMLKLTSMFPVPVFFCHSHMPFFDNGGRAYQFFKEELNQSDKIYSCAPTWKDDRWSPIVSKGSSGHTHYMATVLELNDDRGWAQRQRVFSDIQKVETVFAMSWFTKGTYVRMSDADPGLPGVDNILLDD